MPDDQKTVVDEYWGRHTIITQMYETPEASLAYLRQRSRDYPLEDEFLATHLPHHDEVILDYGCGPGDFLITFLVKSQCRKIIGIDISAKALDFARNRLKIHGVDPARVELIQTSDSATTIPLPDNHVDYVHCAGVIQHTSNPEQIIAELFRVLKPGGQARFMVYVRDSIWYHLYVAYCVMILANQFPGQDIDSVFARCTDGPECPVARAFDPGQFQAMCERAGFSANFLGGHLSPIDNREFLAKYADQALQDPRLGQEHKDFLRALTIDQRGFPLYKGKPCGVCGVYELSKPAAAARIPTPGRASAPAATPGAPLFAAREMATLWGNLHAAEESAPRAEAPVATPPAAKPASRPAATAPREQRASATPAGDQPWRILMVCDQTDRYLLSLARVLAAEGHRLDLAVRGPVGALPGGVFGRALELDSDRQLWDLAAQYHLLHVYGSDQAALSALAAGRPVVFQEAVTAPKGAPDPELAQFHHGLVVRGAAGLIYLSERQAQIDQAQFGGQAATMVLPPAVALGEVRTERPDKLSDRDGVPHLIYLGHPGADPRAEPLASLAALAQAGVAVEVVHGSEAQAPPQDALPPHLGLDPRPPQSVTTDELATYDAGILPFGALDGMDRAHHWRVHEELGRFLAARLPVAAPDLPFYRQWLGESGLGFCFRSGRDILTGLGQLRSLLAAMDKPAKYAYEAKVSELEGLYRQVLTGRPAPAIAPPPPEAPPAPPAGVEAPALCPARTRGRAPLEIAFVKLQPQLRIYKQAMGLKRHGGCRLTLVAREFDAQLYDGLFDRVITIGSADDLQREVAALEVDVIHAHAQPNWVPALAIQAAKRPVVYDTYDLAGLNLGVANLPELEREAERFCLENAAGLVIKYPDAALDYYRGEGYRITAPHVYHQDYCLDTLSIPIPDRRSRPERWQVVHVGNLAPLEWDPAKWDHLQHEAIAANLDRQGIEYHLYPNPYQYDPVHFRSYLELDRKIRHFHWHEPSMPRQLAAQIGRHHWGSLVPARWKPSNMSPWEMGNKFSSYLEAGLQLICQAQSVFMSDLIRRMGVGLVLESWDQTADLLPLLDAAWLEDRSRLRQAREEFSVQRHYQELLDFYHLVLGG